MLEPGGCSKALRVLGQFLENVDASDIGIEDHDEYVEVSWRNGHGEREERFHDRDELAALRTAAELYRGGDDASDGVGLQELLRTLGQELDELEMEAIAIAATPDGFFAAGRKNGTEISRTYSRDELIARTESFRRSRGAPAR